MLYRPYKSPYKRRRTFTPGRDRVGGYYGRFSGASAEHKFFDVTLNDAVVVSAGSVTDSINKIPQGVTESERVGRKCTLKLVQWRYEVSMPQRDAVGTPGAADGFRMIMFIDKQANGATAAVLDVLETANIHSFYNLSNSGRFKIICDKLHHTKFVTLASDGAGVVSSAGNLTNYTFSKALNLPIEFSSTTGAIGEIRSNNIGVILMSTSGLLGFESKLRVRFTDA